MVEPLVVRKVLRLVGHMDVETQEVNSSARRAKLGQRAKMRFVIDGIIVIVMGCLLYYGASWQIFQPYTDAAKYECYAAAFWNGVSSLDQFPHGQCAFITVGHSRQDFITGMQHANVPHAFIQFVAFQATNQPLHALPHEYPILTLLPFSFGLLAPHTWSQVAFAIGMLLIAALIYYALVRYRSRRAALVFAALLVAGGWATAAGRFDLFPSALTLFALLCAVKLRWNWAFFLLALATLLKFYPILLLPAFFIALCKTENWRWRSWRAWQPLGIFVATCVLVVAVSLLLSVEGTVAPLGYFGGRPVQVESLASSLLWLMSLVAPQKLQFAYTFGSLNVVSAGSAFVSTLMVIALITGLLYTFWLQWRDKMGLGTATLLTLLLIMVTGKVFSPQYLIWVVPLLAYVGEADWRWVATWGAVGLLTTWIYPAIYTMAPLLQVPSLPLFYPVVTVRNLLMLGCVIALLVYCARRQRRAAIPATRQR